MEPDVLIVVCTGAGQHPPSELARIVWSTDGHTVWAPGGGQNQQTVLTWNGRAGRHRRMITVKRAEIETSARADGGLTYQLRCHRCHGMYWIRDDRLAPLHDAPSTQSYDLSRRSSA